MMEFEEDDIRLDGLERFAKALNNPRPPYAKIGILGASVARDGKGPTNSQIGAAHEFGAPAIGLPQRSFLRMPLSTQLPKKLDEKGLFSEDELKEVIQTGSLVPWLKVIAVEAVATVKEAFFTGGFGLWPPWAPGYTNQTGEILQDTRQLRDSITEEVVENG